MLFKFAFLLFVLEFLSLLLKFSLFSCENICAQALNSAFKFSEILTQGFIGYYPHACGEI